MAVNGCQWLSNGCQIVWEVHGTGFEKELKTKRAPETKLKTGFLSWLMAIGVLLMAYVAATLEGLARAIACLGVVGVTGVVAMSIMVESAPTERLMPCRE